MTLIITHEDKKSNCDEGRRPPKNDVFIALSIEIELYFNLCWFYKKCWGVFSYTPTFCTIKA